MIHNLFIELAANTTIIFQWTGDSSAHVRYTLLIEDPVSGAPFVLVRGPVRGLRTAGADAWAFLAEAPMFAVHSADPGIRSLRDVWRKDFGSDFSQALDVAKNSTKSVPGVTYASWHEEVRGGKFPLE